MFWKKKQKTIFNHFEELANEIYTAAHLLNQLFHQNSNFNEISAQIKVREHKADQIAHELIKIMSTSYFILPLDREDILDFTKKLDDVVDYIHGSAEAFTEIYALQESTHYAKKFSEVILKVAHHLVEICKHLNSPSKNEKHLMQLCVEIHHFENEGDDLRKRALASLYNQVKNSEITLPYYLAWESLYNTLEVVTDRSEDCANIAEQIVLKYS
jgi:predicted phosphate transport protein (TIGR00153 family)